jgi:hypothetical protein
MTPCRYGALARTPADARLRAVAPVDGHRTVSDRRRILLCDAGPQSRHACGSCCTARGSRWM